MNICNFCKKDFKNPGGLASHKRSCKDNPGRNPWKRESWNKGKLLGEHLNSLKGKLHGTKEKLDYEALLTVKKQKNVFRKLRNNVDLADTLRDQDEAKKDGTGESFVIVVGN
jgi:hypothetical protein